MSFFDKTSEKASYQSAKFVILPVPYEATTSYGKGTKNGPSAVLKALEQVEEFDHELEPNVLKQGKICIAKNLPVSRAKEIPEVQIKEVVARVLRDEKLPILLGGEHSISAPAIFAAKEFNPDLSVLHFDAHADLRKSYRGRSDSHACAMRSVVEVCSTVQVGIRNISEEGYHFIKSSGQIKRIYWADKSIDLGQILRQLSDRVYISFDVDVLDPSEMPSTGTPEPGGLRYRQIVEIFKEIARRKKIVGCDFVELSPIRDLHAPDFLVAKLVYKLISLIGV